MRHRYPPRGQFPADLAERQANYTQRLRNHLDEQRDEEERRDEEIRFRLAQRLHPERPCSRPECSCPNYDPGAGHHDKPTCADCGHREGDHQ